MCIRDRKFTEGHVKYCGEIAKEVMDRGYAVAKLKSGVLGVKIGIMKPDAILPDEISILKVEKPTKTPKEDEKAKEAKPEVKPTEKPVETTTPIKKITEIAGIGPSVVKKCEKAGIKTVEELYELEVDEVMGIEGIGQKTAEILIKNMKKLIKGA